MGGVTGSRRIKSQQPTKGCSWLYSLCTYVCMYVCMYVRTYVRMYVCMYVCMCMYMYMYVCVYIYIYIYIWVQEFKVGQGLQPAPTPDVRRSLLTLSRLPMSPKVTVRVAAARVLQDCEACGCVDT